MPRLRWVRSLGMLVLLSPLILAGCSSIKEGSHIVKGVVKFKGEVLPGGTITFTSSTDSTKVARCGINSDGTYSLDAPEGEVKISVLGPSKPSDTKEGTKAPIDPKLLKKYEKADSSGLTYTVTKESTQIHDVDLK